MVSYNQIPATFIKHSTATTVSQHFDNIYIVHTSGLLPRLGSNWGRQTRWEQAAASCLGTSTCGRIRATSSTGLMGGT